MGGCQTKRINTSAKYYFNDIQDTIRTGGNIGGANDKNANMEQRVSLNCSIKNKDSTSECRVELLIYSDTQRKASKSGGYTESKSKDLSNNIIFDKFFAIPYYFERQQLLDFRIYSGSSHETIQTSLGSIMGSRKQTLIKKLDDGSDFEVKGKEIKRSSKILSFTVSARGNFIGRGIVYSITNLGTIQNPGSTKLYDSELVKSKDPTINFQNCQIPLMFVNPKGKAEDNSIKIVFTDVIHKTTLGFYEGPISNLLTPDPIAISLGVGDTRATVKCELKSLPTFIEYLRSGMNINLTIGIDFTGSNGTYTDPRSLHYLDGGMNDYEKAIRSCGDILAYYDDDQLFPVFGFGFKFKNYRSTSVNYGTDNYPINCNLNDPNINLIDNVLKTYREFITQVNLWGPTKFAPLIRDLNRECRSDIQKGLTMNYNIILILTDGQIDDLQDTIDELVEASFLPVSVIIVGIGDGNFGNMDILDADENPLYDRRGRKADRDLVQFVPFNNFRNNPPRLAEEVLEEVPRQVVEYYQHKGIQPIKEADEDEKE